MSDRKKLLRDLDESPGDWGIRLALMEIAVREEDMAAAKRLVRESPANSPTPPEVQLRVHALLTRGKEALDSAANTESASPSRKKDEAGDEEEFAGRASAPFSTDSPGAESPSRSNGKSMEGPEVVAPERRFPEVIPAEKRTPEVVPPEERGHRPGGMRPSGGGSFEGRLGAPVEREAPVAGDLGKRLAAAEVPRLKQVPAREKWANYEGDLELVTLDVVLRSERPSQAPERASALSFALIAHLMIFFLISLVAVQRPSPRPPELIVSVEHERETEITSTRLTRTTPEVTPAAAAAQAVNLVTSVASPAFSVPELETFDDTIVSSLLPGVQPVGDGMSFLTEAARTSDVNFFGISGRGQKIVFVIDASPHMLVDEKGGMTAYDNVKNEVGVMLVNLNRGTYFNLLLYDGKRLVAFRDEPVPGLPSNLRLAIEWLDPLNRDYQSLGLGSGYGESLRVEEFEELPIRAADVAHYTKAVQKAMEWQASTVFCIVSGYRAMGRSPTPEMLREMMENPPPPREAPSVDAREQRAWQAAIEKTQEWLRKENEARREKGLSPKVVINFNQLVREITGATPPTRNVGARPNPARRLPPVTPDDIEEQVAKLVKNEYKSKGVGEPSLHMVLFLGEGERIAEEEDHFRRLTRKNRGKMKVLRGLAALRDVTGRQ